MDGSRRVAPGQKGAARIAAAIESTKEKRSRTQQVPAVKVLIIEDEAKTAAYLHKGLTENSFVVDVAANGRDGLQLACTGLFDVIILDVMLPGRDGWSVLAALRQAGVETPVLFLTARDAVDDRVK